MRLCIVVWGVVWYLALVYFSRSEVAKVLISGWRKGAGLGRGFTDFAFH